MAAPQQRAPAPQKSEGNSGWAWGFGGLVVLVGSVLALVPDSGPNTVNAVVEVVNGGGSADVKPAPTHEYTAPLSGEEVCDKVTNFLPIIDPQTGIQGVILDYWDDSAGDRRSVTIWKVTQSAMMKYDSTSGCMGEERGDDYWFTAAPGAVLETYN